MAILLGLGSRWWRPCWVWGRGDDSTRIRVMAALVWGQGCGHCWGWGGGSTGFGVGVQFQCWVWGQADDSSRVGVVELLHLGSG